MELPPQPQPEPVVSDKPASFGRELLTTIAILAAALLTAFFIIGFVFRSYQVDGPSMESSLQNGDKLIIWKVPRSWAKITGHDYIPQRGDIVVFTESGLGEYGQQDSKQLIKRVIALPGEKIVVRNGTITVYNDEHPDGFQPDKALPYGKNIPETSGNVEYTLGPSQIFVSGDNRPDSLDSRSFGPIDADQIIGKLVLRVFPVSEAQAF